MLGFQIYTNDGARNSSKSMLPLRFLLMVMLACAALSGCGGGSSSSVNNVLTGSASTTYKAGTFNPSSTYANRCASPRKGTDPTTNKPYKDISGTAALENFWLRSWTHELYLWYSEVPDLNPNSYSDPANVYFPLMKTSAITPSNKDKDKFHFIWNTADWEAFSGSGVSAGYGVEWALLETSPPNRVAVVAFVDPNTPATTNNIMRGELVISVDGALISNGNAATLNAGLFPADINEQHTFVLQAQNGSQRTVTMTSASITSTPVQNVGIVPGTNNKVGYIQFNDHIATAEQQLITAFTTLQAAKQNATDFDLVLDLRYNGGGYLDIASEVAYMIAGSTRTSGKTFERALFNDQYSANVNPVTGGSNPATPFLSTAQGFSATSGTPLPTLSLGRVFVLTGGGTCSASEAIINSLRGISVDVIQIGSTTCGKPYGFYPQDNCGTTYFSIELKGANDIGFGDYTDGFSPANSLTVNSGVSVPGCSIADDFTHQLGDPAEARLAAALFYRTKTSCSSGPTGTSPRAKIQSASSEIDLSRVDGALFKHPWRENRIMRH